MHTQHPLKQRTQHKLSVNHVRRELRKDERRHLCYVASCRRRTGWTQPPGGYTERMHGLLHVCERTRAVFPQRHPLQLLPDRALHTRKSLRRGANGHDRILRLATATFEWSALPVMHTGFISNACPCMLYSSSIDRSVVCVPFAVSDSRFVAYQTPDHRKGCPATAAANTKLIQRSFVVSTKSLVMVSVVHQNPARQHIPSS